MHVQISDEVCNIIKRMINIGMPLTEIANITQLDYAIVESMLACIFAKGHILCEDILLKIFSYCPESMYLVNRKLTHEYKKYCFKSVTLPIDEFCACGCDKFRSKLFVRELAIDVSEHNFLDCISHLMFPSVEKLTIIGHCDDLEENIVCMPIDKVKILKLQDLCVDNVLDCLHSFRSLRSLIVPFGHFDLPLTLNALPNITELKLIGDCEKFLANEEEGLAEMDQPFEYVTSLLISTYTRDDITEYLAYLFPHLKELVLEHDLDFFHAEVPVDQIPDLDFDFFPLKLDSLQICGKFNPPSNIKKMKCEIWGKYGSIPPSYVEYESIVFSFYLTNITESKISDTLQYCRQSSFPVVIEIGINEPLLIIKNTRRSPTGFYSYSFVDNLHVFCRIQTKEFYNDFSHIINLPDLFPFKNIMETAMRGKKSIPCSNCREH
eukprot:NODE_364_length_8749_cov_0.472254.p4 type:complete len:436 gc:universal NODE_364_length_8749_cov_0.472254:4126-2819(-)